MDGSITVSPEKARIVIARLTQLESYVNSAAQSLTVSHLSSCKGSGKEELTSLTGELKQLGLSLAGLVGRTRAMAEEAVEKYVAADEELGSSLRGD